MFNQLDSSTPERHDINMFNVLKSVDIWANADLSNDQLWIYIPYVLRRDFMKIETQMNQDFVSHSRCTDNRHHKDWIEKNVFLTGLLFETSYSMFLLDGCTVTVR